MPIIGEAKIAIICENHVVEEFHVNELGEFFDVSG